MFNYNNLVKKNKLYSSKSDLVKSLNEVKGLIKNSSSNLLENISGQLSRDHLSDSCGAKINDETDAKLQPLRDGVDAIITITKRTTDPIIEIGDCDEECEDLIPNFGGQNPYHNNNQILTHMTDIINSFIGSSPFDLFEHEKYFSDTPCESEEPMPLEDINEGDCCLDCEIDDNSLLPDKVVKNQTTIKGGEMWHEAKKDQIIKLAADLVVADKILNSSEKVDQTQILLLLDPSKYSELPEKMNNLVVEAFVDISDSGLSKASGHLDKMKKEAYYMIGDMDKLNTDDKRRVAGPIPTNYEKWLKNVGESHHKAMSRLEEQRNPLNEERAYRIPDDKRYNELSPECVGLEGRMKQANVNDTKYDPKRSIETLLGELAEGKTARREVDEKSNIEKLLKNDSPEDLWTQNYESRAAKHKHSDQKDLKTTERTMEDDLDRNPDKTEVYDSMLEKWRDKSNLSKTSSFGGGILKDPFTSSSDEDVDEDDLERENDDRFDEITRQIDRIVDQLGLNSERPQLLGTEASLTALDKERAKNLFAQDFDPMGGDLLSREEEQLPMAQVDEAPIIKMGPGVRGPAPGINSQLDMNAPNANDKVLEKIRNIINDDKNAWAF